MWDQRRVSSSTPRRPSRANFTGMISPQGTVPRHRNSRSSIGQGRPTEQGVTQIVARVPHSPAESQSRASPRAGQHQEPFRHRTGSRTSDLVAPWHADRHPLPGLRASYVEDDSQYAEQLGGQSNTAHLRTRYPGYNRTSPLFGPGRGSDGGAIAPRPFQGGSPTLAQALARIHMPPPSEEPEILRERGDAPAIQNERLQREVNEAMEPIRHQDVPARGANEEIHGLRVQVENLMRERDETRIDNNAIIAELNNAQTDLDIALEKRDDAVYDAETKSAKLQETQEELRRTRELLLNTRERLSDREQDVLNHVQRNHQLQDELANLQEDVDQQETAVTFVAAEHAALEQDLDASHQECLKLTKERDRALADLRRLRRRYRNIRNRVEGQDAAADAAGDCEEQEHQARLRRHRDFQNDVLDDEEDDGEDNEEDNEEDDEEDDDEDGDQDDEKDDDDDGDDDGDDAHAAQHMQDNITALTSPQATGLRTMLNVPSPQQPRLPLWDPEADADELRRFRELEQEHQAYFTTVNHPTQQGGLNAPSPQQRHPHLYDPEDSEAHANELRRFRELEQEHQALSNQLHERHDQNIQAAAGRNTGTGGRHHSRTEQGGPNASSPQQPRLPLWDPEAHANELQRFRELEQEQQALSNQLQNQLEQTLQASVTGAPMGAPAPAPANPAPVPGSEAAGQGRTDTDAALPARPATTNVPARRSPRMTRKRARDTGTVVQDHGLPGSDRRKRPRK